MLRRMTQALSGGGLRRRHSDVAPALLPEPPSNPRYDEETSLLPACPNTQTPAPHSSRSWAGQLVVPQQQPDSGGALDPYHRHLPQARGNHA